MSDDQSVTLEKVFSMDFSGKKDLIPDRIALLGIPQEDLTQSVTLALSTILEKSDDIRLELDQTKEQLQEMESLVDVDMLVPIPNRRAFMRRLNWVISMLNRYGHPSSILFFDLNNFKQINDTYGHATGDAAIRHVADILNHTKRESDFLARMGGDEFALILYYADEEASKKRAKEIVQMISDTPFMIEGKPTSLSSSVGVHGIQEEESPEEALHAADMAMFAHKKQIKAKDQAELEA